MEPTDLTLAVLREIRDELKETRRDLKAEIGQTNARLDQTNSRLDHLDRRQHEGEIRLTTELIAVADAVKQVQQLLAARLDVRDKVEDHERRLIRLEERTGQ